MNGQQMAGGPMVQGIVGSGGQMSVGQVNPIGKLSSSLILKLSSSLVLDYVAV